MELKKVTNTFMWYIATVDVWKSVSYFIHFMFNIFGRKCDIYFYVLFFFVPRKGYIYHFAHLESGGTTIRIE